MRRGPALKFPELQSKFQNFLLGKIGVGEKVSGKKIYELLDSAYKTYRITDEELADLKNNWSNYTYRAKASGILQSHGQRKGYSIIKQSDSIDQPTTYIKETVPEKEATPDLIEAFLHIPLTFLLSQEFNSRVISMQPVVDKFKWANPDMLMIRESPNFRVLKKEESINLIKLIDSSPQYILSSIEIKLYIGNRMNVLNALSQTASNGLWANETWLIFFDSTDTELDDDAIAFASATGVGIKRMIVKKDPSTDRNPYVELETILDPQIRNNIRFNPSFSEDGDRKNLMNEIEKIVKQYDDDGSYLEHEGDYVKLADLLLNASDNIKKQNGFKNKDEIRKKITNLSKNTSINDLLKATMDLFTLEIAEPDNLIGKIEEALADRKFTLGQLKEIKEFYELIETKVKDIPGYQTTQKKQKRHNLKK